jgi:hypothetical protein
VKKQTAPQKPASKSKISIKEEKKVNTKRGRPTSVNKQSKSSKPQSDAKDTLEKQKDSEIPSEPKITARKPPKKRTTSVNSSKANKDK